MRQRGWCKLDNDWTSNKRVRRVLREHGPIAGAYWAALVARAHRESHHVDNPSGVIDCALVDIAEELCDDQHRTSLWTSFIAAKLLTIRGGGWEENPLVEVEIHLAGFAEWQWAQGSASIRKANERERSSRAKVQVLQGNGTQCHADGTQCHAEEKRGEETKGNALDIPYRYRKGGETRANPPARTHEATAERPAPPSIPPSERAGAQIARCRHQLGQHALAADELAAIAAEQRGIAALEPTAALATIYRPLALLVAEFDSDVVGEAIAAAIRKGAPSAKFLRRACDIARDDKSRRPALPSAPPPRDEEALVMQWLADNPPDRQA